MKSRKPRKSRKCRRGRRKSDGKCKRKPGPKSKRRRKPRKSHKCSRKTRKSHKCSRKTRKFDIKKSIKFRMPDVGEEVDEVHIWGHGWDIGEVFQIPEGIQSITYLKDIDSRYYEDHQANYMETKYTNDYIPNMLIAFFGASDSFPMKITINDKSIAIPDSLESLSNLSTYILNIANHKVKIIVHACRLSDISGLYRLPKSKNVEDLLKRTGKLQ